MFGLLWGVRKFLRGEEGQTLAEYALILALIAVGAIVALGLLGGAIQDILGEIAGQMVVP